MDRFQAMETFVRVVEAGSFSAAAKLLRIGQPATSKAVAALEERLGVRLLILTTRQVTPTAAKERARRALDEAGDFQHQRVDPISVCATCSGAAAAAKRPIARSAYDSSAMRGWRLVARSGAGIPFAAAERAATDMAHPVGARRAVYRACANSEACARL